MIKEYKGFVPVFDESVYVSESCDIVGNVWIEEHASVWFQSVIRGDSAPIRIGKYSNIQDHCTLHVDEGHAIEIGNYVSVGHNAIIHGAHIEDECLIGMGAIVLNGAHIGKGSIIGAGCVVKEGQIIPKNSLVVGIPARVVKEVSEKQRAHTKANAIHYAQLGAEYKSK